MERLSFNSKFAYNATEAAIHMARYQLAAPFCRNARVLDVACGEGYGALALKRFGATSVEAVDSSKDAINTARKLFRTAGVNHQVGDAARVDEIFPAAEFDLIVSLETIEHITDPERFLAALKKVAKPDAVIIVSCPNDNWYYPKDDQSNPFHVRKYSFDQFRNLTTKVLGGDAVWGYGVPMVGFGNVTDDEVAGRDQLIGQAMMLDFTEQASAITLPQRQFSDIGPHNCSYFVGMWGGKSSRFSSAAVVPISMEQYNNLVSWETVRTSPAKLFQIEDEKIAIESRLTETIAALSRQRAEHDELLTEAAAALARRGAEHDERLAEASTALAALRDERDRLAAELASLTDEKATLDTQFARLSAEAAHEQSKAIAVTLDFERHETRAKALKTQLDAEIASLRTRLDAEQQEAAAGNDRAAALARHLEGERSGWQSARSALEATCNALRAELSAKHEEANGYRVRTLALTKEVDVVAGRAAELAEKLKAHEALIEQHSLRRQELVANHQAELEQSRAQAAQLEQQIAEHARQSLTYRVQNVALSREVEIASAQARKLRDDVAAGLAAAAAEKADLHQRIAQVAEDVTLHRAEAERQRIQVVALAKEMELQRQNTVDQTRSELLPQLDALRTEAERHRVQAFALSKELEVMTQKTAELSSGVVTGGIKAALVRSGKYRVRRLAARVKPILPGRVVSMARRFARKFNM